MASRTEELDTELYVILIRLNGSGHMWLVATVMEGAGLGPGP